MVEMRWGRLALAAAAMIVLATLGSWAWNHGLIGAQVRSERPIGPVSVEAEAVYDVDRGDLTLGCRRSTLGGCWFAVVDGPRRTELPVRQGSRSTLHRVGPPSRWCVAASRKSIGGCEWNAVVVPPQAA